MDTLQNLSLSDEEDKLELQPDITSSRTADPNLNLVGRFLTKRPIRSYMMMEKIKKGPGLYSFQFSHHLDMQRILKKGPWYFDNHLLILDVVPPNGDPNQVTLQYVPF